MSAEELPDTPSSALGRAVLVGVVALYVLAFPYHPGLRSPNELCRLWQTRAIVDHGTLALNQTMRELGPVGDLSVKDGKYYPSKAPLLSFAAVPVYAALRAAAGGDRFQVPELPLVYFSRLFLTVLPTLLALLLVRRFLHGYLPRATADALTATYALGSLAFSYSLLFMSHQLTAALLFVSFFALWRCAQGAWRARGYVVAGAFAGAALAAEYTSALPVAALVLYGGLARWRAAEGDATRKALAVSRAAGLATLGALPFVAFLMAYHQAAFGHPLHSGYKYLADAAYQPWHVGGFLGIRLPDASAFLQSFFSPLRGLFVLSPFLLLGVGGTALLFRKDRALFALTVALLLGYAYFTSSFSYESWGWTTGPRHMTGLVPFLLLPAGLLLEALRPKRSNAARALLGAAAALCAASILITGVLSFINYVPDSVRNPLFGFALPLFRQGDLPPSLLALALPNAWAGWAMLALLSLCALGVLALLVPPTNESWAWPAALATLMLLFAGYANLSRDDARDAGAVQHLHSVWLTPAGGALRLWR